MGRGEVRERAGPGGQAREVVVLHEQVAVGGEHERHVVPTPVLLRLVQAGPGRLVLGLRFDESEGDRLRAWVETVAQHIIYAAASDLACGTAGIVQHHLRLGDLTSDVILGPPALFQRRVDQLSAGISLGVGHGIV